MIQQATLDLDQYLRLLDLCYEAAQSLKGKQSTMPHMPDCQQLAAKLFMHAASIYWLAQGTRAPAPTSLGGACFYDFPSIAVLTRAALETYLTLFEVFLEPATTDELEFNHALWQLSGFVLREGWVPQDPTLRDWARESGKEIHAMRSRLENTNKFASLKRGEQKQTLRGIRRRDWAAVAGAAGFGEQTIRLMYAYYSGYVHADGLSGAQIMGAKTAGEQQRFIEGHVRLVMVVLSKMVIGYAKKFPEARAVCTAAPEAYAVAALWSGAASLLP